MSNNINKVACNGSNKNIIKDKNLETLKTTYMFNHLNKKQLNKILRYMTTLSIKSGRVIFKPPNTSKELIIVVNGILSVKNKDGRIIYQFYSGDYFGELGLLNLKKNITNITITAETDSKIIAISKIEFQTILNFCNEIKFKIKQNAFEKIRLLDGSRYLN